ncbi:MAG: hypothetical protein V2B18_12350, partial [Pseudomonadota bacterium]
SMYHFNAFFVSWCLRGLVFSDSRVVPDERLLYVVQPPVDGLVGTTGAGPVLQFGDNVNANPFMDPSITRDR